MLRLLKRLLAPIAQLAVYVRDTIKWLAVLRDRKWTEQLDAAQYAVTRVLAETITLTDVVPTILQALCESLTIRHRHSSLGFNCNSIYEAIQPV